ncbi:prepilin-type N-terminal cleavage/methylation domain-containing protein [Vibrio fortis]|uniref:prepilin-type N-terminal cleavage/methylation domain-containing protein n=1 Tax=Vibrio fortis TaxID=212667 RepID=UPI001785DE49|nr:prepilin-type N-terminal cleavage/methylation domain-containing protein [Vibrio fortis]
MNLNKGRVKNSKKNQGIALIEMLIVIGIIGLITAGIVALSTNVFNGMDESRVISNLSTVKSKLQKGHKAQGDYVGLVAGTDSPLLDPEDVENPFGADFTISNILANGRASAGVGIKVPGLSIDNCTNILTSLDTNSFEFIGLETGDAGGAVDAMVPGTDDAAGAITGADVTYMSGGRELIAPDVATVGADCLAAGATNNAILVVGFY